MNFDNLQLLEQRIRSKEHFISLMQQSSAQVTTSFVNPFSVKVLAEKPDLIRQIDHFYVDGGLYVKLFNLFGAGDKINRCSFDFSSVACDFFSYCQNHQIKIALIGAKPEEITVAVANIQQKYSQLNIAYVRHGYFADAGQREQCFAEINASGASALICGMGTPQQEQLIVAAREACPQVRFFSTCGGFFTQTSLDIEYWHPLMNRLGLRWLQRAVQHSHVRNRILRDYPLFIWHYLKYALKQRRNKDNAS
ncbi:WecB/TagA/CpsF family glycosyltransferase [Rheinheimera maricola]|uniref:WecB/TagA/CpsF family glycosyltransferase n=1 Tax=Rheinheimera maricola TaxID=2793282 RepID=A0ABS7X409_9GAMM|nr:WecB/TagA/CpsF family glycosyltransferase [Rheinheimera maricola]MBZ9610297.1 WecB/TagA/CpsF family glycosyltransferase [Rheinheimera maricola]